MPRQQSMEHLLKANPQNQLAIIPKLSFGLAIAAIACVSLGAGATLGELASTVGQWGFPVGLLAALILGYLNRRAEARVLAQVSAAPSEHPQ